MAERLLPYELTDEITDLASELDAWKQVLDIRVLPRAWAGRLRRDLEAEAVAASTIMEGVNVTLDEVRRILAGERPPDVSDEDREQVEGYTDAMSFVLRHADDATFEWDRGLLIGLHDRVLGGRYGHGAGRLRSDESPQVWITNRSTGEEMFLPPDGASVGGLVDDLLAGDTEAQVHCAVLAAWVHVSLAAIHPFGDGNGRSARILSSLCMYRGGFKRPEFTSLEEWWGRHLDDYYRLFACLGDSFEREVDVTPFITGHMQAQVRQVRALDLRLRCEHQVWIAVEEAAEDARLDRRLANALWEAFFGRDVTAGYYRSLADVSPATATNDLTAATAAGLLTAVGQRRARRYLAGVNLYRRIADTLTIEIESASSPRDRIVIELGRRLSTADDTLGMPRAID